MRNNQTLDAMLGTLGTQDSFKVPDDFMTGVWQRAGQLGEIVERRRRMALFAGLFVVGLGAGARHDPQLHFVLEGDCELS